ncbi:MIT C-terminal domain-containing protein [Roseivivax sp. CAU 1753]
MIEIDADAQVPSSASEATPPKLEEGHFTYSENRKGVSFEKLFGPYTDGAARIVLNDPYIRKPYQIRTMMEFVEMIIQRKPPEDQISIHLVTGPNDGDIQKQRELLESITEACTGSGVDFTLAFDTTGTAHARDIVTDTGWKIVLDRGLDIFQAPMRREGFSLGDRLQEHRMVKGFYVTYVRQKGVAS